MKSKGILLVEGKRSQSDLLQATAKRSRFGIIDMMVLTAAMALVFSLRDRMEIFGWEYRTGSLWFDTFQHVAVCLLFGLPIAAVYRFLANKRSTDQFFLEPGHWLLFVGLCMVCGNVVSIAAIFLSEQEYIDDRNAFWYFAPGALSGVGCVWILVRGTFDTENRWKPVFLILALLYFVLAGQNLAYIGVVTAPTSGSLWQTITIGIGRTVTVLNGLVCLGLVITIARELLKGPRRGIWHWLGVLIPCISCLVLPVLNYIYLRYFLDLKLSEP